MAKVKKKYELVGSIYHPYAPMDYKYTDQEVVLVEGQDLTCLETIDAFTCQESFYTLSSKLPQHYANKNHFAIRVTNPNDTVYYMNVLYDTPSLKALLCGKEKTLVSTEKGMRSVTLLPYQHLLVQDTWALLEAILLKRDTTLLDQTICGKTEYYWHLRRYMNTSYDEGMEINAFMQLKKEFCFYQNFRQVLVAKQKRERLQIMKHPVYHQASKLDKDISVKGEAVFQREGYLEKQVARVNRWSVEEDDMTDREEFLEPEECSRAYDLDFKEADEKPPKVAVKKCGKQTYA